MNNTNPLVLVVATEPCQTFIQQKADSLPAVSFTKKFGTTSIASYQGLGVEDLCWDAEEAAPFLASGMPVFVVSRQAVGADAVFRFRQEGVRKFFALVSPEDIANFVLQLSLETRRFQYGTVYRSHISRF